MQGLPVVLPAGVVQADVAAAKPRESAMRASLSDFFRASVARRLALFGGGFLLVVLASICAVMSLMLSKRAQERTVSWVDAKVEAVAQAVDAYDRTAKMLVDRFFKVFGDQFGKNFALDEANGRITQLGIALNDYHNPCDKFTEFTGGSASVLMRRGQAFVTASTSLKDDKGERAMGLVVDASHPAYAALLRNQAFVGRTNLYGRSFIIRVQPVRDLREQVVGALLVAFDLTEFDRSLEQMVAGARFFDSGGVYVLDPRGGDAAHAVLTLPSPLRGRALAGMGSGAAELLAALRTATPGRELSGLHPVLKPSAQDRFAVMRPAAGTGWIVVGEVSRGEAMREQWATLTPFLAMFAVAALALCVGQYVLIRRWVGRPLSGLTLSLERVAGGDLSSPVPAGGRDEIGSMAGAAEGMRRRFIEMLGAVRASADAISFACAEISTGNLDLSQRTEETAARLQRTTAAMDQIYGSVCQAADATLAADNLARSTADAAERGGEAIREVVTRMGGISASSRRIAEITGVIDSIAFQTNILALNAAVEAARAGDSGRGFAVVAGEVRGLARRSASAAREIKELIAVSAAEVRAGAQLADAASARMQEILAGVRRVNETLGTINASTSEQSTGLSHINESVATLDRMTQQNAALVEQSAAASESLKEQAAALVGSMARFRLAAEAGGAPLLPVQ